MACANRCWRPHWACAMSSRLGSTRPDSVAAAGFSSRSHQAIPGRRPTPCRRVLSVSMPRGCRPSTGRHGRCSGRCSFRSVPAAHPPTRRRRARPIPTLRASPRSCMCASRQQTTRHSATHRSFPRRATLGFRSAGTTSRRSPGPTVSSICWLQGATTPSMPRRRSASSAIALMSPTSPAAIRHRSRRCRGNR